MIWLSSIIFVLLTSTSAYNQRDFLSTGSRNLKKSTDVYQLFNHLYQVKNVMCDELGRQDERQRINERSIALKSDKQRVQELEKKRFQTRKEVFPRTENGSYKIVNINPEPYPVIANRRGDISSDVVIFPGFTSSSHTSHQRYVPDIPDKCKKLGICEEINNYPHDVVNSIIAEIGEKFLKNRLNVDVQEPVLQHRNSAEYPNIEPCSFNETLVMPQAAQTETGEWYVILNQKGVPLQGFRVQICSTNTRKSCSRFIVFNSGYTARCKQKYIQRAMAAVDVDKREIIYDKTFRVPSCCSCVTSLDQEATTAV